LRKKTNIPRIGRKRTNLDAYMQDMSRVPLLNRDQTTELFKRLENGDGSAKDLLVRSNLRLVISIAKQYTQFDVPFEDLIQEGNIGLMKAIDKFDWRMGNALSTYARWWIKQSIMRHLTTQSRTIRLPAHIIEINRQKSRYRAKYLEEHGRLPSDDEIMKQLKISSKMFKASERSGKSLEHIDAAPDSDHVSRTVVPTKQDMHTAFDVVCDREIQHLIRATMASLPEKEAAILCLRFGIEEPG